MNLRDLGERKAQELIRDILLNNTIDNADMMDDCAVVEFGDDYLLVTTDMISKSTHIPENATFWQTGWHLVAINLSDIAAMGGKPLGLVVALGLPRIFDLGSLQKIVDGMNSCASKFGTCILGGDTKEAETLTLSGCAVGSVAKSEIMLRKGAKPGNIVAVTGKSGGAGAAYYALKNDINQDNSVKNLLEITPRIQEGRVLAKTKVVTSCMDISDGLASSIHQMGILNRVSFQLDFDQIPISSEAEAVSKSLHLPIEELVLYSGGDYELLITIDKDKMEDAKEALSEIGTKISPIGIVEEGTENTLIKDGVSTYLENRGYEHFRWKP
ncbi:MAG: thiamine-phosphate kinase [Thermoplasmata archaeon]|nr:MAG: thiamine-phosphate kinase [Thermoplasmata archaeon]